MKNILHNEYTNIAVKIHYFLQSGTWKLWKAQQLNAGMHIPANVKETMCGAQSTKEWKLFRMDPAVRVSRPWICSGHCVLQVNLAQLGTEGKHGRQILLWPDSVVSMHLQY